MDLIIVEGYNELVRETSSNGIINTSRTSYHSYMESVKKKKMEKDQLRDAVREINTLKSEMHEIKSLILKLVDKE